MADFDRFGAAPGTGGVCEQLSLNTSIHGAEQERSAVDRLGHGQMPVVLENDPLGVSKGFGNVDPLVRVECDAAEAGVNAVVVVESGRKVFNTPDRSLWRSTAFIKGTSQEELTDRHLD